MQVLILMAHGHNKKEIARKLGITYSTVKFYVEQIYSCLGVSNLLDALVKAKTIYPGFTIPSVLDDLPLVERAGKGAGDENQRMAP